MYAIIGASGNTGKIIAENLLKNGKKVRAVSRDLKKIKKLVELGAEPAIGDINDINFLTKTFNGVNAIYSMIPPNFKAVDFRAFQNKVTEVQVEAAKNAGVKYVVTLSSVGAHLNDKAGVVQGLADMERMWNEVNGINILHLRPSYFMENTLGQIDTVKNMGIMGSSINPEMKFPMVATKDIGELAAKRLLALDFKGNEIQYVLGPRDVSYNEVTEVFSTAIDKPDLKYIQFPYDDSKKALIGSWGTSENTAEAFVEFMKSANENKIFEDVKRNEKNTTPTTIEEFASTFANVYNMQ